MTNTILTSAKSFQEYFVQEICKITMIKKDQLVEFVEENQKYIKGTLTVCDADNCKQILHYTETGGWCNSMQCDDCIRVYCSDHYENHLIKRGLCGCLLCKQCIDDYHPDCSDY